MFHLHVLKFGTQYEGRLLHFFHEVALANDFTQLPVIWKTVEQRRGGTAST